LLTFVPRGQEGESEGIFRYSIPVTCRGQEGVSQLFSDLLLTISEKDFEHMIATRFVSIFLIGCNISDGFNLWQ
jgi:hypothetical protein